MIIGLIITIVLIAVIWHKSGCRLILKTGSLTFIDGAVKSGKTSFTLSLALRTYKIALIRYYIHLMLSKTLIISKIFKIEKPEKPLFYSNIPLKRKYVPITKDIITRKVRINYKSVVFISEASLVADNMLYKCEEDNYQVMLFAKLFGHYSKGGSLFLESQSIGDMAVALRRCISSKYYIEKSISLPFFKVVYLRYERYTEDGTAINTYEDEENFKKYLIPKKIFKVFDSYCYSALTDNLKVENKVTIANSLKCREINTFNKKLNKAVENEKKNNQ